MHTYTHKHTLSYTRTLTHTHTHAHTRTHMHTHTLSLTHTNTHSQHNRFRVTVHVRCCGSAGGDLGDSVGGHAVVALAVAASGPHQKRGGHHVQRRRDERQIQRPAQSPVHTIRQHRHAVQQVHPGQKTAHRRQRTQA